MITKENVCAQKAQICTPTTLPGYTFIKYSLKAIKRYANVFFFRLPASLVRRNGIAWRNKRRRRLSFSFTFLNRWKSFKFLLYTRRHRLFKFPDSLRYAIPLYHVNAAGGCEKAVCIIPLRVSCDIIPNKFSLCLRRKNRRAFDTSSVINMPTFA